MNRSRRISRRTVLRGVGAAIGLPLLEAMWPAAARAATGSTGKPPVRMAFLYVPNGMHMPDWTPKTIGTDFEVTPTLQPLANYRSSHDRAQRPDAQRRPGAGRRRRRSRAVRPPS